MVALTMKKVLHIFNYDRELETFPSVYNAIFLWAKQGWENYVATAGNCDEFKNWIKCLYNLNGDIVNRVRQISNIKESFDVIILYDPLDVIIFSLCSVKGSKFKYKNLVHHSLEIPLTFSENLKKLRFDSRCLRIMLKSVSSKFLLKFTFSKLDKLLIQDELRLNALLNRFPVLKSKQYFLTPNSYINSIEPISESLPCFDAIRNISKHLVLYIGAIERWALSLALFDEIRKLTDVTFLFSGWSGDGFSKELIKYCNGNKNIYFNLGTKNRQDLNYMVVHSDIGLAFYDPKDENVRLMGLASGKFHKYLSFGKPVIINTCPYLSEYTEKAGIGISSDFCSIAESIRKIINNYNWYQNNITRKYSSSCNYELNYLHLIKSFENE